jgi:hypothetical protein
MHIDLLTLGIVVLTVATALIHLILGITLGPPSLRLFPLLFYLNAIGYLVLVTALYVPRLLPFQHIVRWVLILYTALTFALWFILAPHRDLDGYIDKAIEIALIILLVIDDRRRSLPEWA